MLKAAEEAMAKVTRDDINQLRSFPSPPLPAAKVVESLIFLFNESHLVKEKVLDGGQKVRDFWEYAKKMILNDKLLKRVEEYKPDTIKNLDKTIVATLKEIIKKP
jgi:dynein heavy chain, axonemal